MIISVSVSLVIYLFTKSEAKIQTKKHLTKKNVKKNKKTVCLLSLRRFSSTVATTFTGMPPPLFVISAERIKEIGEKQERMKNRTPRLQCGVVEGYGMVYPRGTTDISRWTKITLYKNG